MVLDEHLALDERSFVEMVVWRLENRLPASEHRFKYRLAYVVDGRCVVRYDNEAGKGDHRHVNERQAPYTFRSVDELQVDFWADVAAWEKSK